MQLPTIASHEERLSIRYDKMAFKWKYKVVSMYTVLEIERQRG